VSHAQFAVGRDGTRLYVRRREGPPRADVGASWARPPLTAILNDGIACDGFIWKYLWDDLARLMPVVHWH
jgi:hypothetical protein